MEKAGAIGICAGLFYGYVLIPLGLRIRCPFRLLTGLRCPGCGITDMCLSILHGRFAEVPGYNWGLTLASPVLIWLVVHHWLGGDPKAEQRAAVIVASALLVWGVVRNLVGL